VDYLEKGGELKPIDNPGQVIREVWTQFISRPNPVTTPQLFYKTKHPIKYKLRVIYLNITNYFKERLFIKKKEDIRDEIIRGIELKV